MKIHKIEIEKVRGIKKITLEPKGKSIVIFGPNGSGKSAVVDAIDFLLTGKISRLEGEGAGELSTKKHGPHVDYESKEAIVKAQVEIPGKNKIINLERRMSNPRKVICDEKFESLISPALEVSNLGQHKLSRREILKYIMATAGSRASEIHSLLDLEMIDKTRKSLVAVRNSLDKEKKLSSDYFDRIKTDIRILLGLKEFSESECLNEINKNRKILKAENISELKITELKRDIRQPAGKSEDDIKNLGYLRGSIKAIKDLLKDNSIILEDDRKLRKEIKKFNEDIALRKEILHKKLIELGLNLIDDRNICPLCQKDWDAKELKTFLTKRLKESSKGDKITGKIKINGEQLRVKIVNYKNNISNLETHYKTLELKTHQNKINSIIKALDELNKKLIEPIEKYSHDESAINDLLKNQEIENLNKNIEQEVSGLKYEISPELTSWNNLTKLEVLLEQYEKECVKFKKAEKVSNQANLILSYFESARDNILQDIFGKINDDFSNLYKELHGDDEKDFHSSFIPEEAALLFEVEFYGRGKFHPGAMHSEGHQDSMGLCLFLALHKFLAKDKLWLIVLDDVVMSIDSKHRRNVCNALLKHFPSEQFIITTHDRVWANQLKTEGVVNSSNMIEFKWWSIETGPATWAGEDFWKSIKKDLDENDVPQAAWKLRRNGECFLNDVCDLLQAHIVCKSDGNWELGDYLPAAIGQYKKLLNKAKEAANSWGDRTKVDLLKEFDRKLTDALIKTQCEKWAVNPNVHYNKWAEFQPSDFRPVVEAFQRLFDMFICEKCRRIPQLLRSRERKPESVKCSCGKFDWNLSAKKK